MTHVIRTTHTFHTCISLYQLRELIPSNCQVTDEVAHLNEAGGIASKSTSLCFWQTEMYGLSKCVAEAGQSWVTTVQLACATLQCATTMQNTDLTQLRGVRSEYKRFQIYRKNFYTEMEGL